MLRHDICRVLRHDICRVLRHDICRVLDTIFAGCSDTIFAGCSVTIFAGCSDTIFAGCSDTIFAGCSDMIFVRVLRHDICCMPTSGKSWEHRSKTFFLYNDLRKVNDSVPCEALWQVLAKLGVLDPTIQLINIPSRHASHYTAGWTDFGTN